MKTKTEATQTIPDGTRCRFSRRDIDAGEFVQPGDPGSGCLDDGCTLAQLEAIEGATCTVEHLTTATEVGERDFEYYAVTFENGLRFDAISGYHLTTL